MNRISPFVLFLVVAAALEASCARPADPPKVATATPEWVTTLDRDAPLVGKVWSVSAHAFVAPDAALAALAKADYALLGEQHDNADHHRLQARALSAGVKAGRKPTVAMEMIEPEGDALVARYRSDPRAPAAGLGDALAWAKSGWPAWSTYAPIAAVAFEAGLPIVSANLPHPLVKRIVHEGIAALAPSDVGRLGLDAPLASSLEAALEAEIKDAHCGQLPDPFVAPMALAQRARDGQMADRLATAGAPAVLIAGAGHVRTDRGVPLRLRALKPGAVIVSVAFVEVDPTLATPEAYSARFGATSLPFDYVWFTPRASDEDPCKTMLAK